MTAPDEPRPPLKSQPFVGPYEVIEEEELLSIRFQGDYTLEVASELHARMGAIGARYGHLLLLLNVRRLGTVTREARRFLSENRKRPHKTTSIAILGASFTMRTFATMLIRAVSALTNIPAALRFFDSEAEARTWLHDERNRLRTQFPANNLS